MIGYATLGTNDPARAPGGRDANSSKLCGFCIGPG